MCANLISDPVSTNLNLSLRRKGEVKVTSSLYNKISDHRDSSSLIFDSSFKTRALANITTHSSMYKVKWSHTRNASRNKSTTNKSYSRWWALRWEDSNRGTHLDSPKTSSRCQAQLTTKVRRASTIASGRKIILTCWCHHGASETHTIHSPA